MPGIDRISTRTTGVVDTAGAADPAWVAESAVVSLAQLYGERARLTPQARACRWFDAATQAWCECSWAELEARMQRYAAGLRREGLRAGDRVAVQLSNGPDWLALDWAVQALGLVMVGLYNEDSPGNLAYLLSHSQSRLAFLRDAASWQEARCADRLPQLRRVVLMGQADAAGGRAVALAHWLPEAQALLPAVDAQPDALATIVYTSGSTGASRGVMLSHRNVLANVFACRRALGARSDDRLFSVLPLANMFERTAGAYVAVAAGALTIYARGAATLREDLREQRPTVMIAVPRLYERIHAAVIAGLDSQPAPKRALFHLAVEAGWNAARREPAPAAARLLPAALRRRIGEQFVAGLGGSLRLAISGGAPLAPEIARLFTGLGVPLLQGYGLTEAGPVVSVNRPEDHDPASVGLPLDNVETRVSPEGELLVRSPSLMMGYWRDPEATRRAIDEAGWLHTGDKVSRLEARRLYLTGRLKEVIVTATGLKAAPADIEQCLLTQPLIDQVMVVGEARPYLAALIVPRADQLAVLRAELDLAEDDESEAAWSRLEQAVMARCCHSLRHAPASSALRRIALLRTTWTVGNGLLTATLKLRRAAIAKRHAADIERLYAGHYTAPRTDCSHNAGV